jgi:hypothetical protein
MKAYACFGLMATLAVVGCATQGQFLDSKQALAMQTAVNRGKFEMNCTEATPTVISREVIQPALQGPFVNGIQRAEYTIGVAGYGRKDWQGDKHHAAQRLELLRDAQRGRAAGTGHRA